MTWDCAAMHSHMNAPRGLNRTSALPLALSKNIRDKLRTLFPKVNQDQEPPTHQKPSLLAGGTQFVENRYGRRWRYAIGENSGRVGWWSQRGRMNRAIGCVGNS